MENLFELEPEKYWDFTSKYTPERKKEEIRLRILSNEYIGSEKIDGHYNRTVISAEGQFQMQSRTKSTVTGGYADKQFHVPHLAATLRQLPFGTILIGELYIPGTTSQETGKILGCLADKAVKRQEKEFPKLHYYVHDCWYYNGESLMDKPYSERIKYVALAYEMYLKKNPLIERANWQDTPDKIQELLEDVFARDGEGIVLVKKTATVAPGKRTAWKTIKVKRELDHHIDCFFTGRAKRANRLYTGKELESWLYWQDIKSEKLLPPAERFDDYEAGASIEPVTKSYYIGIPGSLEIGVLKGGEVHPIGFLSGLDEEMKANYADYAMKPCEVTCMMFTPDGNLRHARFVRLRDDIDVSDCTWEKYMEEQK